MHPEARSCPAVLQNLHAELQVYLLVRSLRVVTRNIQKIISIFANRTGRICIRVHDEVVRCSQRVKEPLSHQACP